MAASAPGCRIGVDVGGTFTDVVVVHDGELTVEKTASTPDAPDAGVLDGLRRSRDRTGFVPETVDALVHGTTVATNAVLEREWAQTALVTTAGFRDVLEIGRQTRPDLYDLEVSKPEPIVPRDRRFEVVERLDERGSVETPLDEADVERVAREIAACDVDSVAVCLLFSFERDEHERRVATLFDEAGIDVPCSLSCDVLPEIREYERTLATALNAALVPVMDAYIGRLDEAITALDVPVDLDVMQSNGGVVGTDRARRRPIATLLSGPAAGVQGAAHVAGLADMDDVLTMDMGGTSCDVSLVRGGSPEISTGVTVGAYPIGVPMVDVHTIGAGGGSIAWIDDGGALRVGPRSAGADPGPICYGRGGDRPTVTDAHLLLGRLDPDRFLPGDDGVDRERVERAFRRTLAEPMGTSVREAARGVLDVANANMARALRVVSVERGHDPRSFGLVAYGGAGPLHATRLAQELDVPRVLVPHAAGVLSALGLLVADRVTDASASMVRRWEAISPDELESRFETLERDGRERLSAPEGDRVRVERMVDLRYVGQSFELTVPVAGERCSTSSLDATADRFHEHHQRRYGHASPDEPIELVTVRVRATVHVDPPSLEEVVTGNDGIDDSATTDVADAFVDERTVVFDEPRAATVYDRTLLAAGATIAGPALVEGPESTVVVRPEQEGTVDDYGSIVVEVKR